jgi:hypothetical protein
MVDKHISDILGLHFFSHASALQTENKPCNQKTNPRAGGDNPPYTGVWRSGSYRSNGLRRRAIVLVVLRNNRVVVTSQYRYILGNIHDSPSVIKVPSPRVETGRYPPIGSQEPNAEMRLNTCSLQQEDSKPIQDITVTRLSSEDIADP